MKNRIFSAGVYRESMRRMLRAGSILGIVLLLGAVFYPITMHASASDTVFATAFSLLPFMILVPTVGAPVLAWIAFSFLRHRNTSDFYHALPVARRCLYCSVAAALCTWLVLLTAVPIGAGWLTIYLLPHFSLSAASVLMQALCMLTAALQITAVVVFAQCITGTFFSSLIVGGMTLFAPRILIYSITQILDNVLLVMTFGQNGFLSPDYNLGLMAYFQLFVSSLFVAPGSVEFTPDSAAPYLYCGVLVVLFFLLGGVCFCRRRSETAGCSAPSRAMQSLFRVLVFCAISLPITPLLFSEVYRQKNFSGALAYLILYGAAAIAYFAYELITTKRFRNLLRALPGFAVGIALNAALLGLMYGVSAKVLSFTPQPGEVQSVCIVAGAQQEAFDVYAAAKAGEIEIKDREICDLFAAELCDEVAAVKKRSDLTRFYSTEYRYTVVLKTAGGSCRRRITLSGGPKNDKVVAAYAKNEKYAEAYLNLPPVDAVRNITLSIGEEEFAWDGSEAVYDALRREVESLSFETWYALRAENDGGRSMLGCTVYLQGNPYRLKFPLSAKTTPRAFAKFAKIAYERNALISDAFLALVQTGGEADGSVYNVRFCIPSEGEEFAWEIIVRTYDAADGILWDSFAPCMEQLPFLAHAERRAPAEGEAYVSLTFSHGDLNENILGEGTDTLIFAMPGLTREAVDAWTKQLEESVLAPVTGK